MKTFGTHNYYTYILTNKNKTVLYIGMTNNLKERLFYHTHPDALNKNFTTRYRCYFLIYYEHFQDVEMAIQREKQLKGWTRQKKINLIETVNPEWRFLNNEIA